MPLINIMATSPLVDYLLVMITNVLLATYTDIFSAGASFLVYRPAARWVYKRFVSLM